MEAIAVTGEQTLQQGLNEVVMNKVQKMIDGKRVGVEATMERLINEGKIAQDYIAPLGVELKRNDHSPVITFNGEGSLTMNMPDGQFSLHANAIGQLADRMGIPQRYLRTLAGGAEWQIALAATMLNEHSGWTQRSRVLVRTVGTQVRGVLSDSYRRLNSVEILTAFVQEAAQQGAVISDAYMNDTKVWAETILPQPLVIPTAKNGDVVIFAGARFSTSDYGDGAVDMRSFLLNGACLNGMVRESVMKQVHLGSKLPDNLRLSQETYALDTKTTVSAVKDLTSGLFSKDTLMQKAYEIQGASEMEVDLNHELNRLTSNGSLLKSEGSEVQKILMRNDPEDGVQGGATLWKLTQAITAHARELTPERSRELHEISGQLMNRVKITA
ncbi:hypothetical protein [Bacteroides sp.]|uniref:hypothetical protein n=1 Tax=Bacteroides sp. TaxID=29523 RepID=UPI003AADA479